MEADIQPSRNKSKKIIINTDEYDVETRCKLFIALRRLGIRFSDE